MSETTHDWQIQTTEDTRLSRWRIAVRCRRCGIAQEGGVNVKMHKTAEAARERALALVELMRNHIERRMGATCEEIVVRKIHDS